MTTAERKSVLRVMVVGVPGVGKRAVVEDFIKMRADLGEKTTSFEHGHKWTIQDCEVTFHIVDVSPDTVSDKALKRQIRACDAFILMHLVEEKKSFEVLPLIKDVILKEKCMETDLPVFVVGHRVDFKELVVESKIASTVVWDWMMNYRELFEGNQKHNSKLFGDIMERWFGTSFVANTQERKQKRERSFFQRLFTNLKL